MRIAHEVVEYIRKLVRERSGVDLDETKDYLVASRLEPVARTEGFRSIEEMVAKAIREPNPLLRDRLADAMLTTETSFFRDVRPFEALREKVIPELLKARRETRTLSIWSAACSSGQEPYSIAILLREHFPELIDWRISILASDLSDAMLVRAPEGKFTRLEVNRGLPIRLLVKYFQEDGLNWRVNDDIRTMVEFRRINLSEEWPALPAMDVVLLRNVLIYLHVDIKRRVFERLKRVMRPDGYLILGTAETTLNVDNAFKPVYLNQSVWYRMNGSEGDDQWSLSKTQSARPSATSGR